MNLLFVFYKIKHFLTFLSQAVNLSNINYNPRIPYSGEIFVEKRMMINYGITTVVSIEAINEFIAANKDKLERKNIFLNDDLIQ